jgi:hypothetical protein
MRIPRLVVVEFLDVVPCRLHCKRSAAPILRRDRSFDNRFSFSVAVFLLAIALLSVISLKTISLPPAPRVYEKIA